MSHKTDTLGGGRGKSQFLEVGEPDGGHSLRTQAQAIGDVKTDLTRVGKEIRAWIFNLVKRLVAGTFDFW